MPNPWIGVIFIAVSVVAFLWWYAEVEKWLIRRQERTVARSVERINYAELATGVPLTDAQRRVYDWREDGE